MFMFLLRSEYRIPCTGSSVIVVCVLFVSYAVMLLNAVDNFLVAAVDVDVILFRGSLHLAEVDTSAA